MADKENVHDHLEDKIDDLRGDVHRHASDTHARLRDIRDTIQQFVRKEAQQDEQIKTLFRSTQTNEVKIHDLEKETAVSGSMAKDAEMRLLKMVIGAMATLILAGLGILAKMAFFPGSS